MGDVVGVERSAGGTSEHEAVLLPAWPGTLVLEGLAIAVDPQRLSGDCGERQVPPAPITLDVQEPEPLAPHPL